MIHKQHTLRELLTTSARRHEKKIFLETEHSSLSFGTVDEKSDRVATGLNRLGLRPGDRVAILLGNRPEFVFFFLGIPKIGMVAVPIDASYSPEEIVFAIDHSSASTIVTEKRFADLMRRVPEVRRAIFVDDPSFEDAPFYGLTKGPVLRFWPDLTPDDPAVISYTRGTTGARKAVVLSQNNLVCNCLQMQHPFRVNETDRFLCVLPLSSVAAEILLLLTPWSAGATCVLRQAFSPRLLDDLRESRATVLVGMPRLYHMIAHSAGFAQSDATSLRLAICNSGPVGERLLRDFEDLHDILIVEGYGLVEAGGLSCANPYTGVRKPGSLGIPLPGQECRIVDPDGNELPPGAVGEIVIRGCNVMKGYYRDPDASANAMRGGWLHTGDLGFTDNDGYYYLASTQR